MRDIHDRSLAPIDFKPDQKLTERIRSAVQYLPDGVVAKSSALGSACRTDSHCRVNADDSQPTLVIRPLDAITFKVARDGMVDISQASRGGTEQRVYLHISYLKSLLSAIDGCSAIPDARGL